jgi:hypothetical protein
MHSRDLLELAAQVVEVFPDLLQQASLMTKESAGEYWVASKSRIDRWYRGLKRHAAGIHAATPSQQVLSWRRTFALIQEVLVSEVLTRVWGAVVYAHDVRAKTDGNEAIVRSVLLGHREARFRALSLVVHGPGVPARDAIDLNELRAACERWTDMLIGNLLYVVASQCPALEQEAPSPGAQESPANSAAGENRIGQAPAAGEPSGPGDANAAAQQTGDKLPTALSRPAADVAQFAADPGRAAEFAADWGAETAETSIGVLWGLWHASLRSGLRRLIDAPAPNHDLNARIAHSILNCLGDSLPRGPGLAWRHFTRRIENSAQRAHDWVEQLYQAEGRGL